MEPLQLAIPPYSTPSSPDLCCLQANSALRQSFQYFGSSSGLFRTFPGRYWQDASASGCGAFEPRAQSWFAAAATGPKNVIVLMDTSWSMYEESRIQLAISAVADIAATLSPSDWFGVIAFGKGAASYAPTLLPGDSVSNVAAAKVRECRDIMLNVRLGCWSTLNLCWLVSCRRGWLVYQAQAVRTTLQPYSKHRRCCTLRCLLATQARAPLCCS